MCDTVCWQHVHRCLCMCVVCVYVCVCTRCAWVLCMGAVHVYVCTCRVHKLLIIGKLTIVWSGGVHE